MEVTPELWARVFGTGYRAATGLELALSARGQYEFGAPQPRPLPTQDTHVDVTSAPIHTKKSHHFDGSLGPFNARERAQRTAAFALPPDWWTCRWSDRWDAFNRGDFAAARVEQQCVFL